MKLFNYSYNYPAYIFNKKLYNHYLFKKDKNFIDKEEGIYVINIDDEYGILAVSKDKQENEFDLDSIYNRDMESRLNNAEISVQYPMYFRLLDVTPIDATQVNFVYDSQELSLSGIDVTMGIIDTGIDYLNDNFIDENGKSRIDFIWDQTLNPIDNSTKNNNIPYGVLYDNNDINRAIEMKKLGGDPYSIVASKDEVGQIGRAHV